jgi:hypothetical protein
VRPDQALKSTHGNSRSARNTCQLPTAGRRVQGAPTCFASTVDLTSCRASEDAPETSDWQRTALFTAEDVESAVTRAGRIVYGSDARLDHLVKRPGVSWSSGANDRPSIRTRGSRPVTIAARAVRRSDMARPPALGASRTRAT